MSVYYEIKEHLSLQPGADPSLFYLMGKRLAMLGADMLMDGGAAVDTLRVARGAREISFSGQEIMPSLKAAVSLLTQAAHPDTTEAVELDLSYEYRWNAYDEAFSDELGPFLFCGFLDTLAEEELEKLSYTMWNNSDADDTMGSVVCYGKSSIGKLCRGEAPYEETAVLPAEANWYCEETSFIYDETPFTEEIAEACRRLSIAAGNPDPDKGETFTIDGQLCQSCPDLSWDGIDEGEYCLNFVSLPTPESADAFIAAAIQVLRATGRETYTLELLDTAALRPRMLRVTVNADASVKFELTRI